MTHIDVVNAALLHYRDRRFHLKDGSNEEPYRSNDGGSRSNEIPGRSNDPGTSPLSFFF